MCMAFVYLFIKFNIQTPSWFITKCFGYWVPSTYYPNPKLWSSFDRHHHFQSIQWTWKPVGCMSNIVYNRDELQTQRLFHECCSWTSVVGNHPSQRRTNSCVRWTRHNVLGLQKVLTIALLHGCRGCRGLSSQGSVGWKSTRSDLKKEAVVARPCGDGGTAKKNAGQTVWTDKVDEGTASSSKKMGLLIEKRWVRNKPHKQYAYIRSRQRYTCLGRSDAYC